MFKEDCYIFDSKKSLCEGLTNTVCENCPFYQTEDEYIKKIENAKTRNIFASKHIIYDLILNGRHIRKFKSIKEANKWLKENGYTYEKNTITLKQEYVYSKDSIS